MIVNISKNTFKKIEELQQIITDQEEQQVSKCMLVKVLVDIAYEKLIKGETNE